MLFPVQIGMNSSDVPGSLRFYHEAFGYVNAGSVAFWGEMIRVQDLSEPDARAFVWWLIGGQPMFQLEFFSHTVPVPQPLPADWRPSDLGWTRFGVATSDFSAFLSTVESFRLELLHPVRGENGKRRVAVRDPFVGCIVEAIEDLESAPDSLPAVRYVTHSVADLDDARQHYTSMGLPIRSETLTRPPEDEALWGLAGADRSGFVVDCGDVDVEVVRYANPVGRPRPADYRVSDQGIVNMAFLTRDRDEFSSLLDRMKGQGHSPPFILDTPSFKVAYIISSGRETEIFSCAESMDAAIGFAPAVPFVVAGPSE